MPQCRAVKFDINLKETTFDNHCRCMCSGGQSKTTTLNPIGRVNGNPKQKYKWHHKMALKSLGRVNQSPKQKQRYW